MTERDPEPAGTRSSVLIIEDEAEVARHLALTAVACGATPIVAETIGAAWKRIAEKASWMALIVDIGMPDGSGMDMVAGLRRRRREEPVLVLTGLLDSQIVSATFALEVDYLVKPFERPLLEQFLRRAARDARRERAPTKIAAGLQVPEGLQPLVDEVLRWAEKREGAEIQYAGAMARLAQAVRGRDDVTVRTCSEAAGVSRQALEYYAVLALYFSPDELERLLAVRDRRGRAVTRAHLFRLVQAPATLRKQFVQKASDVDFDLDAFPVWPRDPPGS